MAWEDNVDIQRPYNDTPWTTDHPVQDFNVPDDNDKLSTGDLRRKYNFGNTFTTLSAKRDPFLHLLNRIKGGKVATDDPQFKFTTKRNCGPQHRYGYVLDIGTTQHTVAEYIAEGATVTTGLTDNALATSEKAVGQFITLKMAGDYLYSGNKKNAYANANQLGGSPISLLDADTVPRSFLKDQVVKINMKASATASGTNDYILAKIISPPIAETDNKYSSVFCQIIKACDDANLTIACATATDAVISSTKDLTPTQAEAYRCYPVGSAYHELSGYGDSWKDQPWSTDYGYTQIFKTTMMMSNRAQATVLKYEPSEWKRVWGSKLQEHAWDIAQAGYFGVQYNGVNEISDTAAGVTYTQGAVDYIVNNGNQFSWNDSYNVDDFMNDLSIYNDPRTDLGGNIAYFCNSDVWNWMQRQGGYLKNNAEMSTNYDFALTGRGVAKGVPFSKISTVYGDLNLMRDVHLDGTNINILAVNLNGCRYRPLIGNGVNRDTTVYVGVKNIENSGEDYRVDLIQTDAGFEFSQPETHAIWL